MAYAEKRGKGPYPWRVKFKLPDGSWDSASGFATKDDALDHGRDQETDVRRGVFIDPRKGEVTVAELTADWLESIDVGPLSLRDYRSRLNAHILPRWGDVELGAITGMAVRAWLKTLAKDVSKGRADDIEMVFRIMLDDAVKDRLIPANPIQRKTRRGKYVSKRKKPEDERLWAPARQVEAIAANALRIRGFMGYALVETIAYTGMRIAEIAALKVEDCYLMAKRHEQWLDAQWQMQYVDGEYTRMPCKYDSGRRIVIPPFLADVLTRIIAELPPPEDGQAPGDRWLFRAPKGGQLIVSGGTWYETSWRPFVAGRPARLSSRGHRALDAVEGVPGMEELDPHGLRHGHRVWLDEDKISAVAIERRMGHEIREQDGVAITQIARTYSHVSLPMEREVSEVLQARWERAQDGATDTVDAGVPAASG